jgi:hypothetical protein
LSLALFISLVIPDGGRRAIGNPWFLHATLLHLDPFRPDRLRPFLGGVSKAR